ncbi:hypothetical protein BVC80_693g25 [Macleaya cordata]|uniref:Uncharacterized protein n=1 Tax=Macleaya cordata TaxID=56857 RepID=A0A200Q0V9_MACCD|nr:hypothetical protein BVC80_693g25 [Macleaya cordata]
MELSNGGSMAVQHSMVPSGTHHHPHFPHCPHHHHHHFHHCPNHHHHHFHHCRHHHHHHHQHFCSLNPHFALCQKPTFHPNLCPNFAFCPTISGEPKSGISVATPGALDVELSGSKEPVGSEDQLLQEEFKIEEEDEEPIYVMTEEWMEFFAKSEAKRRLEKQAKKKKKKKQGN